MYLPSYTVYNLVPHYLKLIFLDDLRLNCKYLIFRKLSIIDAVKKGIKCVLYKHKKYIFSF